MLAGLGALVVLATAGYGAFELLRSEDPFGGLVDEGRYQAVILANGNVYFGHLRVASDEFYELRDAWFVRDEPAGEGEAVRRVVPLSEEFHGPENRMLIPKDQVAVVENLPPDSPVVEAIRAAQTDG